MYIYHADINRYGCYIHVYTNDEYRYMYMSYGYVPHAASTVCTSCWYIQIWVLYTCMYTWWVYVYMSYVQMLSIFILIQGGVDS